MIHNKTEHITWSDTFSCGIQVIDDQHKELISLVNEMFSHVTGNDEKDREFFHKIIRTAVNYVKEHFATEEKIMLAAKFSGYAEHKMAHDSFIKTVTENIRACSAGKRLSLHSFTKFLKNWVLSHIAVMDKHYFYYHQKAAERKANEIIHSAMKDF